MTTFRRGEAAAPAGTGLPAGRVSNHGPGRDFATGSVPPKGRAAHSRTSCPPRPIEVS